MNKPSNQTFEFLVIDFDGFCVGINQDFASHYLEFTERKEALLIAKHWEKWIYE